MSHFNQHLGPHDHTHDLKCQVAHCRLEMKLGKGLSRDSNAHCVWGKKRNENLWIFSVKNENHYKKIIINMVTDICNDIMGHEDKIKY